MGRKEQWHYVFVLDYICIHLLRHRELTVILGFIINVIEYTHTHFIFQKERGAWSRFTEGSNEHNDLSIPESIYIDTIGKSNKTSTPNFEIG